MIEQPRQYECQRFNRADLVIEIQRFHESPDLRMRIKRPCPNSARELMQAHAFLSEAFGNLDGGKLCKCAERMDPPAIQRFQNFRRR